MTGASHVANGLRKRLLRALIARVPKNDLEEALCDLAASGRLDAQGLLYKSSGILQYKDSIVSGERNFIEKILPKYASNDSVTVCDVGANKGGYTEEILTFLPSARIFAFEPQPVAFAKLVERFEKRRSSVRAYNLALGSSDGDLELYDYQGEAGSEHATFYRRALTDLHRRHDIAPTPVHITTLDQFACENDIDQVDLLKVDTEGHELEVLKGAAGLLKRRAIRVVQFEFNEMNVISRVFLKDFFEILDGYEFYRLAQDRIIPLGQYDSRHEIFKFQNIIAILRMPEGARAHRDGVQNR